MRTATESTLHHILLQLPVILALCCLVPVISGCMMVDLSSLKTSELKEIRLQNAKGWFVGARILQIDVSGTIKEEEATGLFAGNSGCSPSYIKAVLNKAEQDPSIAAVVLRIDSPGGTVTASALIAREISEFKKRTGKPVYAHIHGLGCSGAYYVAAACDKINMQPAAISGSVGVIAILPKFNKLADKVGYEQVVFKSGIMKDIGNSMRDMTDDEKAVFQGIISSSYNDFLDWILKNRPGIGTRDALKAIADGRIYDAKGSLASKLIDRVCHLDETIQAAMDSVGVKDASLITYGYTSSPDANIYTSVAASQVVPLMNLKLPQVLTNPRAGFYYLWMPGE